MNQDLNNLEEKLKSFRAKEAHEEDEAARIERESSNMRDGIRAGTEMVVPILVGIGLGYWLDGLFGTKPLFILVFLFAGIFTAFWNIYRLTQKMGDSVGVSGLHQQEKNATNTSEKIDRD